LYDSEHDLLAIAKFLVEVKFTRSQRNLEIAGNPHIMLAIGAAHVVVVECV